MREITAKTYADILLQKGNKEERHENLILNMSDIAYSPPAPIIKTSDSSSIDNFLTEFIVPPPPSSTISYGMGVEISSPGIKSDDAFKLSPNTGIPPPLSSRLSLRPLPETQSNQQIMNYFEDLMSPPPLKIEIIVKFPDDTSILLDSFSLTVQEALKRALVEKFGDVVVEENWYLSRNDKGKHYESSEIIRNIVLKENDPNFYAKRYSTNSFKVTITIENDQDIEPEIDIFTVTDDLIQLLKHLDLDMDENWAEAAIWSIPLNGSQPRFLHSQETPFSPYNQDTRYMLKFNNDDGFGPNFLNMKIYQVVTCDNYSRNILAPIGVTSEELLDYFVKSLNVSEQNLISCEFSLKRIENATLFDATDLKEEVVFLCYRQKTASSEEFFNFLEYQSKLKCREMERVSLQFPSIEDIRSLLSSFTSASDENHISEQPLSLSGTSAHLAANPAKVAEMLGVSKEMEVDDVKTRLHEIYGKELSKLHLSDDPELILTKSGTSGGNRIGKITSLLGIDSETELAKFLLESSKKASETNRPSMIEEEPIYKEQRDKSAQKVAQILGVNGMEKQFRARKMAQYANISGRTLGDLEDRKVIPKMFLRDSNQGPPKISILNGQFIVKVYLVNQTYKSVQIPLDMTGSELIGLLIERLNIKDEAHNYILFIDKRSNEIALDGSENVYSLVSNLNKRDVLVFKRKTFNNRSSLDSLQSVDPRENRTTFEKRRAAKVANIFGINDRKNRIIQEDNPEIKAVMKMLNSLGDKETQKRFSRDLQIQRISKEGWLLKEEGDISIGQSRTKNCWCFIENGVFHAKLRIPGVNEEQSPKITLQISDLEFSRSPIRKNCFEMFRNGDRYTFYADSSKSCESWLESLKGALAKTNINYQSDSSEPSKITMNDFEIRKVLGRGKFGKVLLCTQKSSRKVYAIKVIKKSTIKEERQVLNSQNENKILRAIRHPFIVSLHYAFQTPERLHLVMEYVNGGELFFHVNHFGRFSEERVRFYAAEIFLAIQCLHGKGIVYRDLKLENILLDKDGHVKVTDFGLSKKEDEIDDDESIIAGTSEYLAPEVLGGLAHGFPADWWAYAVVSFEMLCGYHPFYVDDRDELFHRIMYLKVEFPEFVNEDAHDFLLRLFNRDPEQRLGSGPNGSLEIQNHGFFQDINFDLLFNKAIEPPFKPDVIDDFDVSFFDDDFTTMPAVLTPTSAILNRSQDDMFADFTFNGDTSALGNK